MDFSKFLSHNFLLAKVNECQWYFDKKKSKNQRVLLILWIYANNINNNVIIIIYANGFIRDGIHKCKEAILVFPHKIFIGKKYSLVG